MNKRRIIVFGLGLDYQLYKKYIENTYDVVVYTDRDINKKHLVTNYCEPQNIINYNADYILICSRKHESDIKNYLVNELGLSSYVCVSIYEMIREIDETDLSNKMILFEDVRKSKDTVFVLGDSHSHFFGGELRLLSKEKGINYVEPIIKPFFSIHVGPVLAYSLNKYDTLSKGREKIDYLINTGFIPHGATICLVFGEIDVRVHVIKQMEKTNREMKQVIDDIVNNYMEFINLLKDSFKVIVWGAVAQQNDYIRVDEHFPRFGDQRSRNIATSILNKSLYDKIHETSGVEFVSVYDYLIDSDYNTNGLLYKDGVHLHYNAWKYAREEFKKMGIMVDAKVVGII